MATEKELLLASRVEVVYRGRRLVGCVIRVQSGRATIRPTWFRHGNELKLLGDYRCIRVAASKCEVLDG